MPKQTNPSIEAMMERALRPGTFIHFGAGATFIRGLESVAARVEQRATDGHPEQAAELYELFIAACNEKAKEVDDSGGDLGMFVSTLLDGWMRSRERSRADPAETIDRLVRWMEDDPIAFCFQLESTITKEMGPATLEMFEQVARRRIDTAPLDDGSREGYQRRRWTGVLDRILRQTGDVTRYVAFCREYAELGPEECLVIATMHEAKDEPEASLRWVQRGLTTKAQRRLPASAEYELRKLRRNLLVRLGRMEEATSVVWSEFKSHPGKDTYAELIEIVPAADRRRWHDRAMVEAEKADLWAAAELFLEAGEQERLKQRLDAAPDEEIVDVPDWLVESSAEKLRKDDPRLAGRFYSILALEILAQGKSRSYGRALRDLKAVRELYTRAGCVDEWQSMLGRIRQAHRRKLGFMADLERLVSNVPKPVPESLIDRARKRLIQNRGREGPRGCS